MKRIAAVLSGSAIVALAVTGPPASAEPGLASIDCSATHTEGSQLIVDCFNPDLVPGVVDVFYVCSTPLDFNRQIVFDEPGNPIGAGSNLRLVRDCGPEQVVVTRQILAFTQRQQDDQSARQQQIREQRDRAAGR
ncbi:hypothetical protein JMUB6875_07270 [Nocardia sp. JMUB6875]|uniref:hypothetical protein n=1 Tax=Nocardia sp. JMUB6875 TaxID=3158170 RepID=UPI0032E72F4E